MRILTNIFKSLVIILVILAGGAWLAREVLLALGLSQLKESLKEVKKIDQQQSSADVCMTRGSNSNSQGKVHQTQLRFDSANEYVIEVICAGYELAPIEISRAKLPFLVTQVIGQAGWVWDSAQTALNLSCSGRTGAVVYENDLFRVDRQALALTDTWGPTNQCSAYGYTCCDVKFQQGEGEQLTDILDCPKSCYPTCADRPLILGFTTQPFYDRLSRELPIAAAEPVTFNYVVSPNQQDNLAIIYHEEADLVEKVLFTLNSFFHPLTVETGAVQVVIDFGDGESYESTEPQGMTEHIYQCASGSCHYQARLTVTNGQGTVSVDDLQSLINIKVN